MLNATNLKVFFANKLYIIDQIKQTFFKTVFSTTQAFTLCRDVLVVRRAIRKLWTAVIVKATTLKKQNFVWF
jgi:hypothetical protein